MSNNQKHFSSECNDFKLAIQNDKSEVVCSMCKKCLITANHDQCLLKYVDDMNIGTKKSNAKVSNLKIKISSIWRPKKVGHPERHASPNPIKPTPCLKWSPTGRMFDISGKIVTSSDSETNEIPDSDSSNPHKPKRTWFPNSSFLFGRPFKFSYGASTPVVPSI